MRCNGEASKTNSTHAALQSKCLVQKAHIAARHGRSLGSLSPFSKNPSPPPAKEAPLPGRPKRQGVPPTRAHEPTLLQLPHHATGAPWEFFDSRLGCLEPLTKKKSGQEPPLLFP